MVVGFPDAIQMHNMGIAWDATYYYTCNGGNAGAGQINTYDASGSLVHSTPCYLDLRAIFYNPADATLYGKTYEQSLYRIDPVAGTTSLAFSGIFQFSQSSPAFLADGQTILEHEGGTIRFISLATGLQTDVKTGFNYGFYPFSEAVATDGNRIFTWDESLVYAYDLNGNPLDSFALPYGHYGFSLKFINGMLFASDDGGGGMGYWYGYNVGGVVNQPPQFDHPTTPSCGSTLALMANQNLSFRVQASDPDSADVVTLNSSLLPPGATLVGALPTSGNPVSTMFSWTPTNADVGSHLVTFTATSNNAADSTAVCSLTIEVLPDTSNRSPDCSHATASPSTLKKHEHKLIPISILGVTDPDGDPVTITVTGVTQDEPTVGCGDLDDCSDRDAAFGGVELFTSGADGSGNGAGRGPGEGVENGKGGERRCSDAVIDATGGVSVRAERCEKGNGRVYVISFTATDSHGAACAGTFTVCVPNEKKHGGKHHGDFSTGCVDDGQRFNSLGPCPPRHGHGNGQDAALAEPSLSPGTTTGAAKRLVYSLPVAGDVQITLYDVAGRRVARLFSGLQSEGAHELSWSAAGIERGVYFCRLDAAGMSVSKSVVIIE